MCVCVCVCSTVLRFSVRGPSGPIFSGSRLVGLLRNQLLREKSDYLLFRVLRVDTVCEFVWFSLMNLNLCWSFSWWRHAQTAWNSPNKQQFTVVLTVCRSDHLKNRWFNLKSLNYYWRKVTSGVRNKIQLTNIKVMKMLKNESDKVFMNWKLEWWTEHWVDERCESSVLMSPVFKLLFTTS